MAYAIKYFRDAVVCARYREHGIEKTVGYVVGQARYDTQMRAQRDADHINKLNPKVPVTVVPAS